MATTESDLLDNSTDSGTEGEVSDDTIDDMYDDFHDMGDEFDDDFVPDFGDDYHFKSLWNQILETNAPDLVDISSNNNIRLAIDSRNANSNDLNSSNPFISDSILTYLQVPPLIRPAIDGTQPWLSLDPTIDESGKKSETTAELYVGNVHNSTNYKELRRWFIDQGYGVSRVDLERNKKGAAFAFIRFDSNKTASQVLYESQSKQKLFVFKGRELKISPRTKSFQKPKNNASVMGKINKPSIDNRFEIKDVYYGTLITGAAMRNIHRGSIVYNPDEFGIIAHQLIPPTQNIRLTFDINIEKRRLSFNLHFTSRNNPIIFERRELKFEWKFQDLKARKIVPVLVDQNQIYILVEVKRPPIILEITSTEVFDFDSTDETRQPGLAPLGHANSWLFQLSPTSFNQDINKLFNILSRYNLTQKQFCVRNIIHIISPINVAQKNLLNIQLISNDQWTRQNKEKVDDFLNRRWKMYPFETKFEIMKLLSKHIITVYDLIADEHAEQILKQCSINTLVALTDKIFELAPNWFSTICDDDDWYFEKKEEQNETETDDGSGNVLKEFSTELHNLLISADVRTSATGQSVDITHTSIPSTTTDMKRYLLPSNNRHIGTFSRLLITAFHELLRKHEVRRTSTEIVYVTKLESRAKNINPFLIRKVYITPSTILYEGPYCEQKCAVTRAFSEHQDRFLRVTFRDEDYRVLHDYNNNMSTIYERIKKILIRGISICDRNYQFLAFSSSQLREHSCWMFASINNDVTVDTIRQWMGNFRNVHPVAKLAARLGQQFSMSSKGIVIEQKQFRIVSDIKSVHQSFQRTAEICFTDGIGIISERFTRKIAEELGLTDTKFIPCAFQIRCGGFKGMLCLDVDNRIRESGIDIHFRDSMNKFPGSKYHLDIVRTSYNPSAASLNRQIILLLSALGVDDETFILLLDEELNQLQALTQTSVQACQTLKELNEFSGNGYNKFIYNYLKLLGERKDPFVWQFLLTFKTFILKELRTKAKIRVPDSWCLLGVADETRTLKYGQVFIQIDESHLQKENPINEVVRGSVVVTRNPCFHPGDIRKLEAVDIPALHNLKNVIVFPVEGPGSHPVEMSGGDLDGDIFWISRYPNLIFRRNENPFDYQEQSDDAKESSQTTTQHTIEDVCNFFGEYIAADNLGVIANTHLAFADQSAVGVRDSRCLTLARMHSVAVDFAKNGVCAPRITRELRPSEYPHYMEKTDKTAYRSTTILGILYDKIQYYQTDLYFNPQEQISIASSFPYKYFIIDGNEDYKKEAECIKSEYDRDLKRIMRQYGIQHEVEIVSGFIIQFTSKQYSKETKLFELRNEISHAYKTIQDKYIRLFWEEFYHSTNESEDEESVWSRVSKKLKWTNQMQSLGFEGKTESLEDVKKKASAWFRITYEPWMTFAKQFKKKNKKNSDNSRNGQSNDEPVRYQGLFSFAWLVYPVLLEIFKEKENIFQQAEKTKKKKKKKKNRNKHRDCVQLPKRNNGHP